MNQIRKFSHLELNTIRQSFNPTTVNKTRCVSTKTIKPDLFRRSRQSSVSTIRLNSTIETPPGVKTEPLIPKGLMGQPTCHTHPHLIPEDHLTCGVSQSEYFERRSTLVSKLVKSENDPYKTHIIIIPAASKQFMSEKIPYVFRQNSDFFYLTGCMEPSAVLVMVKQAAKDHYESILFLHEKDTHSEQWEGPRTGCADGARLFAVDEARPIETFKAFIHQLKPIAPAKVWFSKSGPINADVDETLDIVLRMEPRFSFNDPKQAIHEMRVVKSPAEIELMSEACYVGSQAMNTAMTYTKPGVSEHMVNAILEFSSKQNGAEHLAYPPVVAGGTRATHIHYINNNQILQDGEMLLVDAGCQRWLYNSDISRTWPVSGRFTPHQKILYELILTVQKRLITILDEHRPSLDQLFDSMCRLLGRYLQQEGIIPKHIIGHEVPERAYRLCPHHVSHYLGLDVHDSSLIRRNIPVCNNMIVTVEPGIYIAPDDTSVPKEFRGMGIRIEDDILITNSGVHNLTSACVKEVSDVEAMVGTLPNVK